MTERATALTAPQWKRMAARVAAAVLVIGVASFAIARRAERVTPPSVQGAPLRVVTGTDDALFLLTTHHETYVLRSGRGGGRPRAWTERHLDLWRFDAATAEPVWRRRLLTDRDDEREDEQLGPADFALLGAHGGTLWLAARGPRAVSIADGAPIGDASTIEARTPALRGAISAERRYLAMGADGLLVTATDARVYRIDPTTLAARPAARGDAVLRDSTTAVTRPASFTPSATYAFLARGASIPGYWLGMLTAEEGERFRGAAARAAAGPRGALAEHAAAVLAPPTGGLDVPARLQLWSARMTRVSAAPRDWPANLPDRWGTRDRYSDIAPLPESPEFLKGGLLRAGMEPAAPLYVREPDGVFVLHRDRLGDDGRLRLTRVAGPAGRPVWEARLPLSLLQAVLAGPVGRRTITLFGREHAPSDGSARDPYQGAHEQIVSVDVASGAVRAYDLTAHGGDAPVVR
ncbi:MAG: PA2928 family protein [Gemmatirosa sp.]